MDDDFSMTKSLLYIFNPEHDLALASGETNYMAPASARQMAADLALLPLWYAEEQSAVLGASAYAGEFLKEMEEQLGIHTRLVTPPEIGMEEENPEWEFSPWGWNLSLRKRLLSMGADELQLPSTEYLNKLRQYSHRSHAVKLLPELRFDKYFCGESYYLKTPEEWQRFVEGRERCVLKAPLSGSGKGLNWGKGVFTSFIAGWCARVGATQGGVIGEPVYRKEVDFAMEFYSDGRGRVAFVGYSLFRTGESGMYDGNYLLSDQVILKRLSVYVPSGALAELREFLEEKLSTFVGTFYKGYLGVDMMICSFPEEAPVYRIHPCVEINLRMNMGLVARHMTDRYLVPGAKGEFHISYSPLEKQALEEHRKQAESFPLRLEQKRICSGYLPLVPVTPRSRYRAWVIVG